MTRILSYETLRFEDEPGITGFERAIVRDDHGAEVKFWRVPAGWGLARLGVVENLHFHRHAWEYAAFLHGDFPHVEYDGEARATTRIRFGAGDLMIRPPGSIHGLHADMHVENGCGILYWNTGPGTSLLDAGYAQETVDVAGDPAALAYDPDSRCRIDPLDALRPTGGDSRLMSRVGEPLQVELQWVEAGECVPLAELVDADRLFSFLWTGEARLDGTAAGALPVPRWTALVGPPTAEQQRGVLQAVSPACWLRVSRPGAGRAATESLGAS
jgi:hypothetical protein